MFHDTTAQEILDAHVAAHEQRVHDGQVFDMFAFLNHHTGLGLREFSEMPEPVRDQLYLNVCRALV